MCELYKVKSSLQKDINRLRTMCALLDNSNKRIKYQIQQFDLLIKQLVLGWNG